MSEPLVERNLDFKYELLGEDRQPISEKDLATFKGPIRIGGEMQLADVKNANGRIYSESLWRRVLEDQRVMKRLSERRMVGVLDHPSSGKTAVRLISHVMTHLEMRESKRYPGKWAVYGVYECLDTPDGRILDTLLRAKIGIGVSSRGDGELEERDGAHYVVPERFTLDTWDAVMDPSVDVSLGVVESVQDGHQCACVTDRPGATESIASAICSIVESGVSHSDAMRYREVLSDLRIAESSQQYSRVAKALAVLNEGKNKETAPMNETSATVATSQVTEAATATANNTLVAENSKLKTQLEQSLKQLEDKDNQLAAAGKLISEFKLTARSSTMQLESATSRLTGMEQLEAEMATARDLIESLVVKGRELVCESKRRQAAEAVLASLVAKIEEAKKTAHINQALEGLTPQVQESMRPILAKMTSKEDITEHVKAFRSAAKLSENRDRSVPRTARIVESRNGGKNPLEEEQTNNNRQSQTTDPALQESLALSRRLASRRQGLTD